LTWIRQRRSINFLKRLKELFENERKLTGRALTRLGAKRDVWLEVLDGVREIKAGRSNRTSVDPRSPIAERA